MEIEHLEDYIIEATKFIDKPCVVSMLIGKEGEFKVLAVAPDKWGYGQSDRADDTPNYYG